MIPAGRLSLSALLLAASPAMAEPAPSPSGIYSNVKMSERTGDLGGMEARFFEADGRRMVEFVWCEGWCNESFTVPVTRRPEGFAFSYFQLYADGGADAGVTMRFLAWPEGKRLRISAWQGDRKLDYEGKPQTLGAVKRPFGLTVAKGEKDTSDAEPPSP